MRKFIKNGKPSSKRDLKFVQKRKPIAEQSKNLSLENIVIRTN